MVKNWHNLILPLIIVLSLSLRLIGIFPSYPPYHSDEGMSYSQGIYIIKENNLNAEGYSVRLGYPFLIPYINALSFKLFFIPIAWSKFFITNIPKIIDGILQLPLSKTDYTRIYQLDILGAREIYVLTWGRILAALFGVGVVILTYFLGRIIFNKYVGLIAAFLVSVNYRHVLNSHLDLPDIYNSFFLLLSFIFSYRLFKNRRRADFLLAGLFVGLSFATKFHVYAVPPFLISYLVPLIRQKEKIKNIIFSYKLFFAALIGVLVFLIINPFHFIHLEEAIETISYESKKYGTGRIAISVFPFWYLFNYGIGQVTLLLSIVGGILLLFKNKIKFLFMFSSIGFFFYFVTYVTNGGYYTRNFVTIIPIILILPAYLIYSLFKFKKLIFIPLIIILILFVENFSKSVVVINEYSKPWNYEVIGSWLKKNIPNGANVAAHSSVPLPDYVVTRLSYESVGAYSIQEFQQEGADFAVTNLDWISNDYYGWMNRFNSHYWGKPLTELMQEYSSMATSEVLSYSLYSVIKPALAPESNFIVAKVPKYTITDSHEVFVINNVNPTWRSEALDLSGYKGIYIKGNIKNGFIYVNFFKNIEDSKDLTKRITSRVSAREVKNNFIDVEAAMDIPDNAKYAVVGFLNHSPNESVAQIIEVYNANVNLDFGGYNVHETKIDEDVLFPNSQGNL